MTTAPPGAAERWSAAEKFAMGVETAALSAAERGEYCRKRGLYPQQLHAWRRTCEQANAHPAAAARPTSPRQGEDRRRIRAPERELARKEKALAEAAALWVLRKKAAAIRGTDEDA